MRSSKVWILPWILAAAGVAFAQEPAGQTPATPPDSPASAQSGTSQQPQAQLASDLFKKSVYDTSKPDEAIGKVEDLVLDASGKATHAVISYGGTLGLGAKQTVIPWKVLTASMLEDRFLLDRAKLEGAPMVDTDQMTADSLPPQIDEYWTTDTLRTAEGEPQPQTEQR